MRSVNYCLALILCSSAIQFTGCAKGPPELTVVSGKVVMNGQPIRAGTVEFVTTDNIHSAIADLMADGTYRMPGAPVGPVRIAISTAGYDRAPPPNEEDGPVQNPKDRSGKNPRFVAVPAKYHTVETSDLSTTIEPGQNTYDIEIPSK
jgi:hypothetical protein